MKAMTSASRSSGRIAAVLILCGVSRLAHAANSYTIEQKDLVIGQLGQTVAILCENDFPLYGLSVAIKYENAKIKVTGLALAGDATDAEWTDLEFDNVTGEIVIGAVLDFSPSGVTANDNVFPVGAARQIVVITLDVLSASPTTTLVDFRDNLGAGSVKIQNMLTNASAATVKPTLGDRTLTIRSIVPEIASVNTNVGRAGDTFFAVVNNIDLPALTISVEVCGVALTRDAADGFKLLADKKTLSIVAPECGPTGFAPLKVTTPNGSDTEPNGFNYLAPIVPVITTLIGNDGQAGKVFQVTGQNFDQPGLAVKVCGKAAIATLRADKITIDVTAPACANGWAVLEVSTVEGSDSEANGFNYLPVAGKTFLRADANGDNTVDLADAISVFNDLFLGQPARAECRDALDADDTGDTDLTDGIYILNYLFQGGGEPKPPFPGAGLDPTEDSIPACL